MKRNTQSPVERVVQQLKQMPRKSYGIGDRVLKPREVEEIMDSNVYLTMADLVCIAREDQSPPYSKRIQKKHVNGSRMTGDYKCDCGCFNNWFDCSLRNLWPRFDEDVEFIFTRVGNVYNRCRDDREWKETVEIAISANLEEDPYEKYCRKGDRTCFTVTSVGVTEVCGHSAAGRYMGRIMAGKERDPELTVAEEDVMEYA